MSKRSLILFALLVLSLLMILFKKKSESDAVDPTPLPTTKIIQKPQPPSQPLIPRLAPSSPPSESMTEDNCREIYETQILLLLENDFKCFTYQLWGSYELRSPDEEQFANYVVNLQVNPDDYLNWKIADEISTQISFEKDEGENRVTLYQGQISLSVPGGDKAQFQLDPNIPSIRAVLKNYLPDSLKDSPFHLMSNSSKQRCFHESDLEQKAEIEQFWTGSYSHGKVRVDDAYITFEHRTGSKETFKCHSSPAK